MEVELLKKYGSVRPGEIENLDGTTETVDFRFSTVIRFYHNMRTPISHCTGMPLARSSPPSRVPTRLRLRARP